MRQQYILTQTNSKEDESINFKNEFHPGFSGKPRQNA